MSKVCEKCGHETVITEVFYGPRGYYCICIRCVNCNAHSFIIK